MPDHTTTRATRRPRLDRRARLLAAVIVLAGAAACVPPTDTPTTGSAITVSPSTEGVAPGSMVTVHGAGFTVTGNLGTRPPFLGQPAGVYVVFGRFTDPWRPSTGASSGSRQIISQVWALPQAQHDLLDPTGALPEIVLLRADGAFDAELVLTEAGGSGAYGIATYAGSGAINSGEELVVPVTFAP